MHLLQLTTQDIKNDISSLIVKSIFYFQRCRFNVIVVIVYVASYHVVLLTFRSLTNNVSHSAITCVRTASWGIIIWPFEIITDAYNYNIK